jgi:hypothetical protein
MTQSPPYLHPFACFVCQRSFRRPGVGRDEATCPVCGSRAVRLSRKFKAPRRGDTAQWAKVEALVKLGFRFDTLYDTDGAIIRYPSSERGIPAFVNKVAQVAEERAHKAARSKAALALRRRQRQAARARRAKNG